MLLKELLTLNESQMTDFQLRVSDKDDWQDVKLRAASLDAIAAAVDASPADNKAHAGFDLGQLTAFIEKFIGDGPDGYGSKAGSWDEMDYEVKSHKDDVLKISWTFSGQSSRAGNVKKAGTMTIMG